jgi:hypothetical protein
MWPHAVSHVFSYLTLLVALLLDALHLLTHTPSALPLLPRTPFADTAPLRYTALAQHFSLLLQLLMSGAAAAAAAAVAHPSADIPAI